MFLAFFFLLLFGLLIGGLCGAAIQKASCEDRSAAATWRSASRGADYYLLGVDHGRSHLPLPRMEAGAWD